MKNSFLIIFILIGSLNLLEGQIIYNPQELYDASGGIYESTILRELNVDFEDPDYHSILVDAFFANPSYRIPATITLDGEVLDSVGVRYKGNSTFCLPNDNGNPKVPYNLDMNYWVSGQKLMGYKKLKLANAWLDPTFAKEFTGAQIYRKYLPTPEVNLLKLNVQGDYLGLYVNTESINKQFLEKHFGEKDGVLFKGDGSGVFCGSTSPGGEPALRFINNDSTSYYNSYTIKSDNGWKELMDLINTLDSNPEELENILNIDRVLWAFAVNSVLLNLDVYNGYYVHNYYLYQTEDGLFQMIPWDLDNTFVGAILGWDYWDPTPVYEFDPYFGQDANDPNTGRPLAYYLLNHPLYRKQYTAHLRTVIEESLDVEAVEEKVEEVHDLIFNAASQDPNKLFPMNLFNQNVDEAIWATWGFGGILSSMEIRKTFLLNHPEINQLPPSLENINVSDNILTVTALNETVVELMATTSPFNSKFQSFPMFDDGTNGDAVADDGIYSCILPFNGSMDLKFYIRAQNDEALVLSPERAEYEFYQLSTITNTIDPELYEAIKIYPNPTSSKIYIETGLQESMDYEILSPIGQVLSKGVINTSNQEINLVDFPPSIYFIKIGNKTFKILKTKT